MLVKGATGSFYLFGGVLEISIRNQLKFSDKMDNFDDDFGGPPPADVDPAAEFLAKEQVI